MFDQTNKNPDQSAPANAEHGAREKSARTKRPTMVRAELLGLHSLDASNGLRIHVWRRGDAYLARGYYKGARFGETLGVDLKRAQTRLMEMVAEIGRGVYVLPSQRNKQQLAHPSGQRLTIRQLVDEFLTEKRNVVGEQTANDYRARLVPLIEFAECDRSLKRWPMASNIDREFVVEYRNVISARKVTRNGRSSAPEKRVSARQAYNILDCARSLFNWAKDVQIAKLPIGFLNPFTANLVGEKARKDPLRPQLFPLGQRIQIVQKMDEWQLSHLALSMTLPLRPEDCAGLLIADVDFERCDLTFFNRFGGRDFNKGRTNFRIAFPTQLLPLLCYCAGGRTFGPLFRSRSIWDGRRKPRRQFGADRDTAWHIEDELGRASPRNLKTSQDHKKLVRRVIRDLGGVSEDSLGKEFGIALRNADLDKAGRFYDLRGAINTEMERTGVSHLVQRYVTGHTTSDILYEYVAIDPAAEMQKYFTTILPLLDAMFQRAKQLGLKLSI